MESFGQKLRQRARQLGLSDAEVARRAGLSERRYGNYVTGKREPAYAVLLKLCAVLDADPNSLLGFKSAEFKPQRGKRVAEPHEKTLSRLRAGLTALDENDGELLAQLANTIVRVRARTKKRRS